MDYKKEDEKILDVFSDIIAPYDSIEKLRGHKLANKYAFIDTAGLVKLHVYSRVMRFFNKPKKYSVRLLDRGIEIKYCSICTAISNIQVKYPKLYNDLLNKVESKRFISKSNEEEIQTTNTILSLGQSTAIPPKIRSKFSTFHVNFKKSGSRTVYVQKRKTLLDKYKELETENENLRQENSKLKREREIELPSIRELLICPPPIVYSVPLPPSKRVRYNTKIKNY